MLGSSIEERFVLDIAVCKNQRADSCVISLTSNQYSDVIGALTNTLCQITTKLDISVGLKGVL
jgi:hypothetical protein